MKTIGDFVPKYAHLAPIISPSLEFPFWEWELDPHRTDVIIGHWCEDGGRYEIVCPPQLRELIRQLPAAFADIAQQIQEVEEERDEARAVNDQSQCAYCGHVGPKDKQYMAEHVLSCENHPLNLLIHERLYMSQMIDWADLMCDEFQRIASCPGADSEIKQLCERSVTRTRQNIPLIEQRDNLERELHLVESRKINVEEAADALTLELAHTREQLAEAQTALTKLEPLKALIIEHCEDCLEPDTNEGRDYTPRHCEECDWGSLYQMALLAATPTPPASQEREAVESDMHRIAVSCIPGAKEAGVVAGIACNCNTEQEARDMAAFAVEKLKEYQTAKCDDCPLLAAFCGQGDADGHWEKSCRCPDTLVWVSRKDEAVKRVIKAARCVLNSLLSPAEMQRRLDALSLAVVELDACQPSAHGEQPAVIQCDGVWGMTSEGLKAWGEQIREHPTGQPSGEGDNQ